MEDGNIKLFPEGVRIGSDGQMSPINTALAKQRERTFVGFTVNANAKRLELAVKVFERSQPVGALSEIGLELWC